MTVMCTCGHKIQADTTEAAWRLFDDHVDAVHGNRWPAGSIKKGEVSMTANAIKARRLRAARDD